MVIFFNISHPAHAHFFKNTVNILKRRGHKVLIGVRDKECTIKLIKSFGWHYTVLTKQGSGALGLFYELLLQQIQIYKIMQKYSVDLMFQIGGIFNAPIGKFFNIPAITMSDTENDKFLNKISFSLSKYVLSPTCFIHNKEKYWANQILYPGYHELTYLSPKYFKKEIKPQNKFLLRFVGWGAVHDIGEQGLSDEKKNELVKLLNTFGQVYISSESTLPPELESYRYSFHPSKIHDFMRNCKLIVGESATMASEAACMGIPAIFISNTGRGYTTEEDKKYSLIKHYTLQQWDDIINTINDWIKKDQYDEWQKKRWNMLNNKIEVTDWLVDFIENYPESINTLEYERYKIYDKFEK